MNGISITKEFFTDPTEVRNLVNERLNFLSTLLVEIPVGFGDVGFVHRKPRVHKNRVSVRIDKGNYDIVGAYKTFSNGEHTLTVFLTEWSNSYCNLKKDEQNK